MSQIQHKFRIVINVGAASLLSGQSEENERHNGLVEPHFLFARLSDDKNLANEWFYSCFFFLTEALNSI